MNDLQERGHVGTRPDLVPPRTSGRSKAWKVVVAGLAVVGAIALVAASGMLWMHGSMMGGMGMGMGMGRCG